MADTVQTGAPVGTGAVIASDDAGAAGQVQIIKLAISTDGSATVIPADATVGLRVDPASVAVADGGTLPTKGVQVGGTDGSVFQTFSTDNAGRLNTNINGTVPVSGTVTADTELPAAGALADGASNPTTSVIGAFLQCFNGTTWDRVKGDATNGIFANVKTSVLPTGAATAAKQPTLGTAGTPSTDVLSVQGVSGGTAVPVSGTVTASGPVTDTQLRASPVPVSGTVTANLGTAAVTNAGTFAVQDSEKIVDDAAFGVASTKLQPIGFLADETSTDSVDEGDLGAARMTLDRKLIVTVEPHTAGGWSVFNATSGDGSTALTNTAQAIKASLGKLGGWFIFNPNAAATAYVPIYNVASGSVTVGTTNPLMVLAIPANSAANVEFANGITFDTAISAAAATTAGGATALGTAVEANFYFK